MRWTGRCACWWVWWWFRMWQEYFRIVAFDEYIAFGPTHTVWCAQGAKRLAERCGLVLAAHGGPLEWGAFALHCGRRRRHNDNNPHPVFEKSKLRTYPETGTFLCFVRNPGCPCVRDSYI